MPDQQDLLENTVKDIKDNPKMGKDDLSIWGGRCAEGELLNFLQNWALEEIPYRIWEYVSEITFDKDSLPKNETLLEHGRMFGPGGDLTIRRDGANFRWHFVGRPGQPEPPASGNPKNFWDVEANRGLKFHRWKDKALLWGKYAGKNGAGEHYWHDDRVARAKLTYPVPDGAEWERVMIKYYTFSQAGQVQFVWFRELVEWEGAKDADGNN